MPNPSARLLAAGCVFLVALGCKPDARFNSLASDVTVFRDEWGSPHVYARAAEDGLFGLGYETARDRLFQLDLDRRRALGREAELFGEKALKDDRLARVLGFGPAGVAGAADLEAQDPSVHRTLSAYAQGITAFIADAAAGRNGAQFPPEYADLDPAYVPGPWAVADSLAMLKAELFLLAVHPETDLLAYAVGATVYDGDNIVHDLWLPDPLEPVYITAGFPAASQHARAVPKAPASRPSQRGLGARKSLELADALAHFARRQRIGPVGASNNWALCGSLTASGAPMLANDPHLPVDLPGNLYEFHLEADGLRVAGFGIPGLPAALMGHNESIAWGVTTVEADISDTYLEQTEGDAVRFQGEWVPMQVRDEVIRVRKAGGPVAEADEVTQRVRVVPHHGPVLSDAVDDLTPFLGTKALSVKWLGFGISHESRAFYDLERAHNYADFHAALGNFEAGLLNFVFAGTDGDLGYYPHASYPIRAQIDPKNPPWAVVPGTGKYEWTGALIPDDRIPQLHNPSSCRVFSANNDPAGVTRDGDPLNDEFYLGGTFDYGLRARRIQDRLDLLAGGGVTLDDFASMQADVHSGLADHFLPPLLQAAHAAMLSPAAADLLAVLEGWDREDTADQVPPTVFAALYSQLIVDVFADDLSVTFSQAGVDDRTFASTLARLVAGLPSRSGHDYLGGKAPAEVLVGSLEKIALSIPAELGADRAAWAWGKVHTNTFNHPLGGKYDIGPVGLAGGQASIDVGHYGVTVDGKPVIRPDVFEAPNCRVVIELLPGDVTMRAVLPTGESGVLGDPHYADQLDLWRLGKTRAAHFRRDDVEAQAQSKNVFPSGFPAKGAPHG